MRINTNLSALMAFNSLNATNKSQQKSIAQLSTGLRINSAADDAAGFAMSEKMRAQIGGLDAALRNSQDGISLLQTAEGALGETNSILQRMRELSVQASNDTLTSQDRQYLQLEIDELRDQIDRIASTTQFNRKRLLDGSCGAMWSSSEDGLKAKIHGGLEYVDDAGQKVSSEGNYRIEITAEPGQAQVQKSSILGSDALGIITEEVIVKTEIVKKWEIVGYRTEYIPTLVGYGDPEEYSIDISTGLDPTNKTSGNGWTFTNGTLTITGDGAYSIVGDGTPTTNNIVVQNGVKATIFLKDVNIDTTGKRDATQYRAFDMTDAVVDLYLDGENTFKASPNSHDAGIGISSKTTLTINSISGDYSTDGKLTAIGAQHSAGIGSSCQGDNQGSGKITIKGGEINAQGGKGGAGIGGGSSSGYTGQPVSEIVIEGGIIVATGGDGGAGIGTGANDVKFNSSTTPNASQHNSKIFIKGGTVIATGGASSVTYDSSQDIYKGYPQGAGIGGGGTFNSGTIEIQSGASVIAFGYNNAIGCGQYGDTSKDNINTNASFTLDPAQKAPDKPTYRPEIWKDVPYEVPIWDEVEYKEQVEEKNYLILHLQRTKSFSILTVYP